VGTPETNNPNKTQHHTNNMAKSKKQKEQKKPPKTIFVMILP